MISQTNTSMITGAKLLVDILSKEGVDKVFGYPGATVLPLYDELCKVGKIKHYLTRHEQGAVHIAEGYARVSRKPAVVLVTSGPGATNTITGILNAYADNIPLVIVTGQSEELGANHFQEADIVSMTKTCTKKSFCINSVDEILPTMKEVFKLAQTPPMGPVLVALKRSVLLSSIENKFEEEKYLPPISVQTSQSNVFALIDDIKKYKKPLFLVGGGCYNIIPSLRELFNVTNLPVVNTLMGKGMVDDLSLGMIGVNGVNFANSVLQECDLLIALGARLDTRVTGGDIEFLPNTKIININIEKNKTSNVTVSKEITGDITVIINQLLANIHNNKEVFPLKYGWLDRIEELRKIYQKDNLSSSLISDNGIVTEDVLRIIHEYTKKYNPIVTTDVGQHQILTSKIFKSKAPYNFLTSGGLGTMGFGMPAGIGACIAKPDSLVISICGDGSFQMNMQELGTCKEYNIPIKIIVMNNSSLGLVKQAQAKYYNGRFYQSDMLNPDFVQIASAYGILGVSINSTKELELALNKYITKDYPVLFDIHTINAEVV